MKCFCYFCYFLFNSGSSNFLIVARQVHLRRTTRPEGRSVAESLLSYRLIMIVVKGTAGAQPPASPRDFVGPCKVCCRVQNNRIAPYLNTWIPYTYYRRSLFLIRRVFGTGDLRNYFCLGEFAVWDGAARPRPGVTLSVANSNFPSFEFLELDSLVALRFVVNPMATLLSVWGVLSMCSTRPLVWWPSES